MFCPSCGQENVTGARTCVTCGADLTRFSDQIDSTVEQYRESAGFWLRLGAYILDSILVSFVFWIVYLIFFWTDFQGSSGNISAWYLVLFSISSIIPPWLYYALMEASSKQATVGKMALGIKVTDEAGNRISFGRATGRHFAKIITGFFLCIIYIIIAFTKKKQGLHDMLAGTLVVKK